MLSRYQLILAAVTVAAGPIAAQTTTPPPAPVPTPLTPAQEAHLLSLGKTYTRWFLAGHADSLAAAYSTEMLEKTGGVENIRQQMTQVRSAPERKSPCWWRK